MDTLKDVIEKNLTDDLRLVERYHIKVSDSSFAELNNLCLLSKNLYNSTLYAIRQHYFKTKQFMNYNKVNKIFTDENQDDYRALPAKVSKMTQMLVQKAFNSYFALIKKSKKDLPEGFKVKLPKYLPKDGRQVVEYTKQALSFKEKGFVNLSGTSIKIPLTRTDISFVRIVPKTKDLIILEVGYEKEYTLKFEGNVASIDLGLNNFAMVVGTNFNPYFINGRPLKSINQYYNKKLAEYKSDLMIREGRYSSNKIRQLTEKRNNKVNDFMHKASREVVNHLVSNKVHYLVVGYNKSWKQDINLGKKVNQNFVQVPFLKFVKMLEYKCALVGIKVVVQQEAYTSKCSFLDGEFPKYYSFYKGKRVKRGLFRSLKGYEVNADVNGAYNILRKHLEYSWNLLRLQGDCKIRCLKNPRKVQVA